MNLKLKRAKELAQFFAKTVREEGLSPTMHRTAGYLRRRLKSKKGRFWPSKELCAAQRAADTSSWPRISFCVPFYNTPKEFLTALCGSLAAQTCPNWELCAADASDDAHAWVGEYLRGLPNVRYVKVENRGISANTNAAAALATGE